MLDDPPAEAYDSSARLSSALPAALKMKVEEWLQVIVIGVETAQVSSHVATTERGRLCDARPDCFPDFIRELLELTPVLSEGSAGPTMFSSLYCGLLAILRPTTAMVYQIRMHPLQGICRIGWKTGLGRY